MSKQTAVEWLKSKISDLVSEYALTTLFEQAKAMEREQMRVTYNQGLMSNFQNFEEYYIQTYKGGEQ